MHRLAVRSLLLLTVLAFTVTLAPGGPKNDFLRQYKGKPFHDNRYQAGPQRVPGVVLCAYYDLGGEGVAFHTADTKNHGSGELNPANGDYLNEFRKGEAVGTSYTKFGREPAIDDSEYNLVTPPSNLQYVGWTKPGEWFNLTVEVAETRDYSVDLLYTSFHGGSISFDVNGESATQPLLIRSTWDPNDPLDWRQWHHWNRAEGFVRLHLTSGRNVITVHIVTEGEMNLAILNFK
ncbi:MAG: hypothetical protein WCE75_10715 [Terracidiphilus sp.]